MAQKSLWYEAVYNHGRAIYLYEPTSFYGFLHLKNEEHYHLSLVEFEEELQWLLVVNACFANSSAIREINTLLLLKPCFPQKWENGASIQRYVYINIPTENGLGSK